MRIDSYIHIAVVDGKCTRCNVIYETVVFAGGDSLRCMRCGSPMHYLTKNPECGVLYVNSKHFERPLSLDFSLKGAARVLT